MYATCILLISQTENCGGANANRTEFCLNQTSILKKNSLNQTELNLIIEQKLLFKITSLIKKTEHEFDCLRTLDKLESSQVVH